MFELLLPVLVLLILCPRGIVAEKSVEDDDRMQAVMGRLRDSVDRFDAHFQRAFDEYARTESVREFLDDLVVPRFRFEEQPRLDFEAAARRLQQRLQPFFDAKVRALRRLARAAEEAARGVDVDTRAAPSATMGEARCAAHMRALNASEVQNAAAWGGGTGEGLDKRKREDKSGVHVALETYKCSEAVKRDFDWTGREQVERAMADNAHEDRTLGRQYLGTYSGLTRMYPGFHWDISPEQFSIDLFEPRLRPWFTAAETVPRDVLFLLDFSGSARGLNGHLIKTSVMAVLQTMTPNDFFTGIWYNSRRAKVMANCTEPGDSFVPANTRNKLLFRRFLDRIEERDQAVLPPALEASFAEFIQQEHADGGDKPDGASYARRSGGHRLVLLFTDGIEFWPTEVVRRFQREHAASGPIRVFGHSMGLGRGAQPALAWLTCETRAGLSQAEIGAVAEVRLKARAHMAKLSEVLALAYRDGPGARPEGRPVAWPAPYMDAQRGGPVVSLSMPLLGRQPAHYRNPGRRERSGMPGDPEPVPDTDPEQPKLDGFIGVAGLDVRWTELAREMRMDGGAEGAEDEADGMQAYAFLVDNNGLLYYHPRMPTPPADAFAVRRTLCHRISTLLRSNTRVPFSRADEFIQQRMGQLDSVPQRDLLELEPDTPLWRRFRARLVRRQCDGTPLEDAQRQLRCFALEGTPLVVGMVLEKARGRVVVTQKRDDGDEEEQFELAEQLETAALSLGDAEGDNRQYTNSTTSNSVGVLLSSGPIRHWDLSAALSSVKPLRRLASLARSLPSLGPSGALFVAHLAALSPHSLLSLWARSWPNSAANSAACPPRPLPPRMDPRLFRSAFLQLRPEAMLHRAAISVFFPRCEFSSVQSLLQQQMPPPDDAEDPPEDGDNKLKLVVPDLDAVGTAPTLSVHRELALVARTVPLARVGVQFRGHFLQQKLQRALQQQQPQGWQECTKAGRKCLLVSADSVLLATSEPQGIGPFRPVHLSNAEPELFGELSARGFIRKSVWRDPEARCPMVITLDARQLQRQQYLQHIQALQNPADSVTASAVSLRQSPLRQIVALLPSTLQWIGTSLIGAAFSFGAGGLSLDSAADSSAVTPPPLIVPLDSDCEFEGQPEMVERCTVEHTRYRLRSRAKEPQRSTSGAVWMRDRNCNNRTIGLLPFPRSELFLVLTDGDCTSKPSADKGMPGGGQSAAAESALQQPFVAQRQVPNCNLTRDSLQLERTMRPDLDYTRAHPKEFNPICTTSSALAILPLFSSLFCFPVLLFFLHSIDGSLFYHF